MSSSFNRTSDAVFKLLPRETIRAAIFILHETLTVVRGRFPQTAKISQISDGIADAQALLDDKTLSWPFTVQKNAPLDHAL